MYLTGDAANPVAVSTAASRALCSPSSSRFSRPTKLVDDLFADRLPKRPVEVGGRSYIRPPTFHFPNWAVEWSMAIDQFAYAGV
jgi:hypothetical protein